MVSALISRFVILTIGTLYPAYRSYKGVKTKNVREYVKWMMYWIVFAIFLCVEAISDIFVAFWCPLYYELKCLFVVWLLSPYTRGASLIYRKFVHPFLLKHEQEIDLFLDKLKQESYTRVVQLGNKGVNYAKEAVAMAALKGHEHIVGQIRKTVSLNDVTDSRVEHSQLQTTSNQNGLQDEEEDDDLGIPSEITTKQRVRKVKQRPALVQAKGARLRLQNDTATNMSYSSTTGSSTEILYEGASSIVDEEFGYLNEEDEYDNDDDENYCRDTVDSGKRRKHHDSLNMDSTNDTDYQLKTKSDKFATMPRRSGRKVTKKE